MGSGKTSLISAILGQVRNPVLSISAPLSHLLFHLFELCRMQCVVSMGWHDLTAGVSLQMTLLEGSIAVSGTFAYVAQQAWILNATLRDNILFGKDYDEERSVRLLAEFHESSLVLGPSVGKL